MGTLALVLFAAAIMAFAAARRLDLTDAVVTLDDPSGDQQERKAAAFLVDEVARRSGVRWPVARQPVDGKPTVILSAKRRGPAEGYALSVRARRKPRAVLIEGNDVRGRLFGIGRLLQELHFAPSRIEIEASLDISCAPQVALRGHQLASRPKSNSYDAWDKARFEQYLRDLIIFGANALEIVPSITPDDVSAVNEIMPVDPWEMTLFLAELAREYGLLVCMWVPNDEGDILTAQARQAALGKRRRLYESCKRVDQVFVPGGDPGNLHPRDFMPLAAEHAALLKSIHPDATMWVSHQNFRGEALDYFYRYLQTERPDWLDGVVYAPWVEDSIQHTREMVPAQYALRRYPDICHTIRCQYPQPAWDQAFAITANREPICPRPMQYAHIHNLFADFGVGFVTYSDGVADDLNKFVLNAMGWDRGADVRETVTRFARVFISEELAAEIAAGIMELEHNWFGPLERNDRILQTLAHWQDLERRADAGLRANWRFQQMLLRAYFDAYVQARLRFERGLEREATRALSDAVATGAEVDAAIASAKTTLARADVETPRAEWRARVDALADDLWESIGAQLTVERHHAQAWERGAMVTTLRWPLNNRRWIERELDAAGSDEASKLAAMRRIVEWETPGPGGFYDNLGQRWQEPHLVWGPGWERDPGFVVSAQDEFEAPGDGRLSWQCQAQTLFGAPLRMRYEGLDRDAAYRLRITYAGRHRATATLTANGTHQIHGPLGPSDPIAPVEFDVPRQATATGALELEWRRVTKRAVQVAEVWLMTR
jgi:hypothetical protein